MQRGIVVDCRNDIEQTPLHVAIIRGNTTIIEMLISHGADVNTGDIDGMVPLHMILYCRDSMHVPSDLCPEILKVVYYIIDLTFLYRDCPSNSPCLIPLRV